MSTSLYKYTPKNWRLQYGMFPTKESTQLANPTQAFKARQINYWGVKAIPKDLYNDISNLNELLKNIKYFKKNILMAKKIIDNYEIKDANYANKIYSKKTTQAQKNKAQEARNVLDVKYSYILNPDILYKGEYMDKYTYYREKYDDLTSEFETILKKIEDRVYNDLLSNIETKEEGTQINELLKKADAQIFAKPEMVDSYTQIKKKAFVPKKPEMVDSYTQISKRAFEPKKTVTFDHDNDTFRTYYYEKGEKEAKRKHIKDIKSSNPELFAMNAIEYKDFLKKERNEIELLEQEEQLQALKNLQDMKERMENELKVKEEARIRNIEIAKMLGRELITLPDGRQIFKNPKDLTKELRLSRRSTRKMYKKIGENKKNEREQKIRDKERELQELESIKLRSLLKESVFDYMQEQQQAEEQHDKYISDINNISENYMKDKASSAWALKPLKSKEERLKAQIKAEELRKANLELEKANLELEKKRDIFRDNIVEYMQEQENKKNYVEPIEPIMYTNPREKAYWDYINEAVEENKKLTSLEPLAEYPEDPYVTAYMQAMVNDLYEKQEEKRKQKNRKKKERKLRSKRAKNKDDSSEDEDEDEDDGELEGAGYRRKSRKRVRFTF